MHRFYICALILGLGWFYQDYIFLVQRQLFMTLAFWWKLSQEKVNNLQKTESFFETPFPRVNKINFMTTVKYSAYIYSYIHSCCHFHLCSLSNIYMETRKYKTSSWIVYLITTKRFLSHQPKILKITLNLKKYSYV